MSFNLINNPKAWTLTVADGSSFGGPNLITVPGLATSLIIDALTATADVTCQFNGDDACEFPVHANASYGWSNQDIQVTSIDFANSSGSDQTISVIAGNVINA